MLFVDVRMHSASWRIGDEPTAATLARMMTETTIPGDPRVESKTGCLVMAPKGDNARVKMNVCTQQCMAVIWVRKRHTTCDM